ncbi:MAG: hypothetical protein MJ193_01950, partial [Clostridia bacterium]|nr:hypothetical protein [Clostridia bacterium]
LNRDITMGDITMAAEYDTLADIEKDEVDGNVVVSYVATPINEVFFGSINGACTINMRYKNASSSVLMFVKQNDSLTGVLTYDSDVIYE